jgi:FdhD protein
MNKTTITTPYDLTAVVLAGGRSLRMGVDKTQMLLDGRSLLARAIEAVYPLAAQTILVTNRPDEVIREQLPDDVLIVTDEVAYQGPLGGIVSACVHAKHPWLLTIAADMPWINSDVVRYLWDKREGSDVVIPVGPRGPEPLLALYRKEVVEPKGRAVLASGRRRIVAMFDELRVNEVARADLEKLDPSLASFFNINTRADFAKAQSETPLTSAIEPHQFGSDESARHKQERVRLQFIHDTLRKLPVEAPITIHLGDVEVATVQATPSNIDDLAIGFLVSEGLLTDREKLKGVDIDAKRGAVYVSSDEVIPDDLVHRTRYVTSGCGKGITFSSIGHARNITPIQSSLTIDVRELYEWMAQLATKSIEYHEHGGCHSCGLVIDHTLVLSREDIGRHNAVDKVVGHAWLDRMDLSNAVLLSSGRISYEMVVKAAKSHIPIIASRSATTDLAVEIANELYITLAGYVRGRKVMVYTHTDRIVEGERDG